MRTHRKIIEDAAAFISAAIRQKPRWITATPAVGNRYVIIRYENEAYYDKFYNSSGKDWMD